MRTLSLDIGKSESYIQKVMDNKMNPTLDTLSDIARYFDIPFTSLFSQEAHPMEFRLIEDKLIKLSSNELTFLMQIIDIVLKMKSIEE